jgi:hypothetical protein
VNAGRPSSAYSVSIDFLPEITGGKTYKFREGIKVV